MVNNRESLYREKNQHRAKKRWMPKNRNNERSMRSYGEYHFSWKDWLELLVRLLVKGTIICYLFYDTCRVCFLLLPFAVFDYHHMKRTKLNRQKRQLTLQFKAMMEALVTSLHAGYSLEHAFMDARTDMQLLYDNQAVIFTELDWILQGLKMNIPLEKMLKDFGDRSGVEDIQNFANVVMAAKRSGGNLIQIIQKTTNSITDKIVVEEEIETLITAKKLEERIMMIMPYGIIFYLRVSNGEFLEVLYHNVIGAFLMTVFLVCIYIADLWAGKIMEIRV